MGLFICSVAVLALLGWDLHAQLLRAGFHMAALPLSASLRRCAEASEAHVATVNLFSSHVGGLQFCPEGAYSCVPFTLCVLQTYC